MKLRNRFFYCLLFLLTMFTLEGRDANRTESILEMPVPESYVSDLANVLAKSEEEMLEGFIAEYDLHSSIQIAVVTVSTLEGMEISDVAQRLAQQWGVGQKEDDNGILILIKPKYSGERGRVFISVGYGMEHVVPDAIAKRIVESIMIPLFRKNEYYLGIYSGIDAIIGLSNGEYINEYVPFYERKLTILIAILIGISFLLLPIIYLLYLRRKTVPEAYGCYYIKGVYNSANLFAQLDLMEREFDRKYVKFRKYIKKYEYSSRNNLLKYAGKIDRNMFCYLLNGRSRKKVFWEMSDPFLKIMIFYIAGIFLSVAMFLRIELGWIAGLIGLVVSILVLMAMFNFLISFLEIFQFSLRSKAKYVGGVSVALFSLNAIFKRNIKKSYNSSTNSWVYAPIISYSSGGGGFSGGGFSGGGFGGFGGGGFGGGGAGGSW